MTNDQADGPAEVTGPNQPKQAGDAHLRWEWVEPSVGTERRLTRLEQSEPKTVWYGLWDKVISERNLQAAFWSVWRNAGAPGVDGQTVRQFEAQEVAELAKLHEELRDKRYHRQAARRVWLPKPGTNEKPPLGLPAVRDRRVEAALKQVLEPIFEHDFAEHSYGFRPGRGCREAVKRVEELLSQGYGWCVELDFRSAGARTDIRARLRRAQLRVSARTRMPRGGQTSGGAAEPGLRLVRGTGFQGLLRHDTARGVARVNRTACGGRKRPGAVGAKLESWRAGRDEMLGAERSGNSARSRYQSAVSKPVSQCAGPRGGEAGLGEGALRG